MTRARFWNDSKLLIAPQGFKSWRKITNNITAPTHSGPVIARSAAPNKIWTIITCTTKQSHSKKHSAKNNVLKVLQTWDCHTKHFDSANYLIYSSLVRNDNFIREIVQNFGLRHRIIRELSSQSEGCFARFWTFDRGRLFVSNRRKSQSFTPKIIFRWPKFLYGKGKYFVVTWLFFAPWMAGAVGQCRIYYVYDRLLN